MRIYMEPVRKYNNKVKFIMDNIVLIHSMPRNIYSTIHSYKLLPNIGRVVNKNSINSKINEIIFVVNNPLSMINNHVLDPETIGMSKMILTYNVLGRSTSRLERDCHNFSLIDKLKINYSKYA